MDIKKENVLRNDEEVFRVHYSSKSRHLDLNAVIRARLCGADTSEAVMERDIADTENPGQ